MLLNNYSNNRWLNERFNGPDGNLWLKARKMLILSKPTKSALDLFNTGYITARDSPVRTNSTSDLNEETNIKSKHFRWTDNTNNSVCALINKIITRWNPKYLNQKSLSDETLHTSLIDMPCQPIRKVFDDTENDVHTFEVAQALKTYQACFVPLLYHELWHSISSEQAKIKDCERRTTINVQKVHPSMTSDGTEETAVLIGTYATLLDDPFEIMSATLTLFDLVLITIDDKSYFGIVIHVDINEIAGKRTATQTTRNNFHIDLITTVQVYVSCLCANAFEAQSDRLKSKNLEILKLTNIKSERSMINAVYDLEYWPQHRSFLKPTIDDHYFRLPDGFDRKTIKRIDRFNPSQAKVITIAECMFADLQERLHMVHGPPGTGKSRTIARIVSNLLPTLQTKKLLLCAPSNKACDELLRRIVDEFREQNIPHESGTILRVGRHAPDDYRLAEYFLDHQVLQRLVQKLRFERHLPNSEAKRVEEKVVKNGKIFISTLNYCTSRSLKQLTSQVALVIVDEATQGLEADLLIPLRFRCQKMLLIGDPEQLPPTVLSTVGGDCNLHQSLYTRLYSIFKQCGESNSPITMLTTQYRMHPEICRFPSRCFYDGRLQTHPLVDQRMAHFPLEPLVAYDLRESTHYMDVTKSSFNKDEVDFIRHFCAMLVTDTTVCQSLTAGSSIVIQQRIAVITPYQAQVHCLRNSLPPEIEVMTIDSSQGSERDIVIISCVRATDSIGFLCHPSRMNVMLTRAKYGLYIVGSLTWLAKQDRYWQALVDDAQKRGILRVVCGPIPTLPRRPAVGKAFHLGEK